MYHGGFIHGYPPNIVRYTVTVAAATASGENRVHAFSLPLRERRIRKALSSMTFMILRARSPTLPHVYNRPSWSFATMYGTPPTFEAITGKPLAMASAITIGVFS
jgi:hypothetical protein